MTQMFRDRYEVRKIKSSIGKEFIKLHHYSHGCHNGPMCWGFIDTLDNNTLVGVIAFATPSSENVRRSVFGPEHKDAVTELHRLVILDTVPRNGESYLIAHALKLLSAERPNLHGILSFADSTEGHRGIIYQATNALFCGMSSPTKFYLDPEGRLRHPRQNGVNIDKDRARVLGWTPVRREAKYRYLFIIGNRRERRLYRSLLKLTPLPYPKG